MLCYTIPKVKICCISSKEEALAAIKYGADALGLVGHMPSGPGVISDEDIRDIAAIVPPPIATFLLTSETSARGISHHHQRVHTNTIQLVDYIEEDEYVKIRKGLPGIKLVQVIHIVDHESVEKANRIASYVDAILLDSGNPNLEVKQLGGTGKTHNWDISRRIRESLDIPLFLAGGLTPENVRDAIEQVEPFGVDVCTGVRTRGKLDTFKLRRFFEAVKSV